MLRNIVSGIWILLFVASSRADTYVRQPSVDVIHYDISVELADTSNSITGTTKIHVLMRNETVSGMWLDFADMVVDKLRIGGIDRPFTYREGRLSFNFGRAYSRNEVIVIEVQYHGKPQDGGMLIGKNRYGRRVIFTDNWPDHAHHWFPSIDHPSDKATVDVTVTAPDRYDIVSNGRMVRTTSLLDGRKLTQWSESKAIPTYCIAIGAAEFSIVHQRDIFRVPISWYSYPQDTEAAAGKFDRTSLVLAYFETLIAPYPYEKLAQVESIIQAGGMENASSIFYGESSFEQTPVSEYPVPHEIAHQWFGDSVTEADWDHLWLSEGFATYFDALFYEYLQGPEFLKQTMAAYADKLDEYKPARSAALIDPGQKDLDKKLNPINYEKGAWILHMLRGILGDESFFEGIRRYYRLYEGRNALSEDFKKVMESASGMDLSTFFRQWLYQPGWPEYRILWHWNDVAGEVEMSVRQTQTTGLFDMPLRIAFFYEDRRQVSKFRVTNQAHSFRIPLSAKPLSVETDPDGWVLKSVAIESY
jgi:aminopeptidase N